MRKRLEALRDGWTTPNVFPWDELTDIICELESRIAALESSAPAKTPAKKKGSK